MGGDQYDVVKIDIEGDDIRRLNALISESMEHTDTHPTYQPHCTLAYVKPGLGQKYVGECDVTGQEVEFTECAFSGKDREHTAVKLHGVDKYAKEFDESKVNRADDGQFAEKDAEAPDDNASGSTDDAKVACWWNSYQL